MGSSVKVDREKTASEGASGFFICTGVKLSYRLSLNPSRQSRSQRAADTDGSWAGRCRCFRCRETGNVLDRFLFR
jgi:hypothetical protein